MVFSSSYIIEEFGVKSLAQSLQKKITLDLMGKGWNT